MRHATDEDLDAIDGVLVALRQVPGLRERSRGSFSRGSRAFLHFHADGDDAYVDVRLTDSFERLRITSADEQADFLSRVQEALRVER